MSCCACGGSGPDDCERCRLIQAMESAATFMRGMTFDPRIPNDTKDALRAKADELDNAVIGVKL